MIFYSPSLIELREVFMDVPRKNFLVYIITHEPHVRFAPNKDTIFIGNIRMKMTSLFLDPTNQKNCTIARTEPFIFGSLPKLPENLAGAQRIAKRTGQRGKCMQGQIMAIRCV